MKESDNPLLCYNPIVIGIGGNIKAAEIALKVAKERGIKVVVVSEPHKLPEKFPFELLINDLETKLIRIKDEYIDYKDGKAFRRERRAKQRKNKRSSFN